MNTENLIKSLTNELPSTTKVVKSGKLFLIWASITFVFIGIAMYWLVVASNLDIILESPAMILEAFFTLLLGVLAAAGAFILSVPGKRASLDLKYMAVFPMILWSATVFVRWSILDTAQSNILGPAHCLWAIVGLSIIPSTGMFYLLKRAAPLNNAVTGFLALTSCLALAAFVMRLGCTLHTPMHQFFVHFLPVFVIGGLGIYLGKKLLSW